MKNTNKRKRKPYEKVKAGRYNTTNRNGCGDDRESKSHSPSDMSHKYNDVSWYAKNPEMLRDAASFSYNSPVGNRIPVYQSLVAGYNEDGSQILTIADPGPGTVPGLIGLTFVPTIGTSTTSTSPANLAAQNIYSYVRYMNSGAKNYDQADLMIYLLSMDSIYMMWNWAKRMYGYARMYAQKNRYMPLAYARIDGIDLVDMQEHLADYRLTLNALASQISSFCVPAVMPLFVRHSWMVSNIYKDSEIEKAQQYMFTPSFYYQYDETGSQYGGQLLAKSVGLTTGKFSEILTLIQDQLDAIAYSEDIGVMSGDILKAYGQDKLFKITPVDPMYTVEPVYNEEVLNQIHNSSVIGTAGWSNYNITQDPNTGYLIYNPSFPAPYFTKTEYMVNMPWNDVTPENTMVGTRLSALLGNVDATSKKANIVAMGTEFINARNVVWFNKAGALNVSNQVRDWYSCDISTVQQAAATVGNLLQEMELMSNFDWHPLVYVFTKTKEQLQYYGILGDISNYTMINVWNLQQMHTTAILSEFNVPQIGSF